VKTWKKDRVELSPQTARRHYVLVWLVLFFKVGSCIEFIGGGTVLGFELRAHPCNPSYSGGSDQEDHGLKPDPRQIVPETLSPKIPNTKKVWKYDFQVVSHLPSKSGALSSNPILRKKNKQ
jgi:hypothetical protein